MNRSSFYTLISLVCFITFSFFERTTLFAQSVADTSAKKDTLVNLLSVPDTTQNTPAVVADSKPPVQNAQTPSKLLMEFVKEKIEHSPDSTYFNILKITNNNGKQITGVVTIAVPRGWKLISDEKTSVSISPGNTEYIPIRVSLDRSATGGISYLINATLTSDRSLFADKNQTSISKACYITIPQKRKWDIFAVRTVYFDRYSEYSPLKLRLINKGNGNELVKLEFEIGSALAMSGSLGRRHFASLELKPHSDTTISFPVKYFPPDESELWNRDFKKHTIRITAIADTLVKRTSVNFKYLESSYTNVLAEKITPLNIEVQLQNLLSESSPSLLIGAYGMILLKNEDVIDYNVRFMNILIGKYKNTADVARQMWTRSRMTIGYKSKRWEAKLGDNVGYNGSAFFGSMGRGIGGLYKINAKNKIGGSFNAAVGTPMYSGNLFHEIMLPQGMLLRSSVNGIADNYNKLNTYGASAQFNYPFLPGHTVSLLLASSITQHNYNNQTFLDNNGNYIITNDPGVTRLGFASQIGYSMNLNKLTGGVNVLLASKDFSQYYSGRLSMNGHAQYVINRKYSLIANSGLYLQDPRTYYRGILFPRNKFFSGTHRVELATRMNNKLTLFTGPVVEHISFYGLKINRSNGDSTYATFRSISPKLSLRCSYKNNLSGFINPYAVIGYTFITFAEDSSINVPNPFFPRKAFFNAKFGLNVIQSNWGMNIFYYYGPQTLSAQTDYYYFGSYSKSLRVMPYFQKYYFHKKILLSSYNSYYYEVETNNERITLNARVKFFLGRDWTFYVDNNLYLSSRINSEGEKVYGRNYFLNIGVTKSFDIPQPLIKYYDLKVICFKDINGNQVLDENERGISDVVVSVGRQVQADSSAQKSLPQRGQFAPAEMVTDNFGQVVYYNIPEGEANLSIFPLQNLVDIFILNGQNQIVNITRDTTYYVPFAQSYRAVGNVILNRDEYSGLAAVSLGNIRITATDSGGNSFPTLTNMDGSYLLYVPKAGVYTISINNVFGEQFIQQESEYTVIFDGAKEFQVDFMFDEKKRAVNMNGASTSLDTILGRTPNSYMIAGKDTLRDAILVYGDTASSQPNSNVKSNDSRMPQGPGITYRIQLTTSTSKVPASQYPVRFKGVKNVSQYSEGGIYKYTAGEAKSIEEAKKLKADIRAKGFSDAFMVPFYKGNRVRY